jgi:hypothetical protein
MKVVCKQVALLLVGGFLIGCRPQEEKHYYPTGQMKSRVALDHNGLYQGDCLNYTQAGELASKVPFQHGVLAGVVRKYYPTGELQAQETFRGGKRHGRSQYFYATGTLKATKQYVRNVAVGTFRHYYPSGRLQGRVHHNGRGAVVDFDFYTPAGKRDASWTKPLVLSSADTVSASQPYTFQVVLANALSNAVTVKLTAPGNALDSLPAPRGTHRFTIARPHPGANWLRGQVYNQVFSQDTLHTYSFELRHSFWVRPTKATK